MLKLMINKEWLVIVLCLLFNMAFSQEEQVAFIPGVFELSKESRIQADVLNEFADGFQKAKLYRDSKDYFLRIDYQKRSRQWTEDFPISIVVLAELRSKLQEVLSDESQISTVNATTGGRAYLISSTSLHAIAQSRIFSNVFNETVTVTDPFFGPYSYEVRTRLGMSFPYLATAGAITGSVLMTRDRDILPSAANMHFWGSLFGYGHGFLLTSMIREPYGFGNRNNYLESIIIPGTSIIEGWIGYQIAKRHNFTYTRSKAINSGNFWGGVVGIGTYGIFVSDDNFQFSGLGFSGLLGSGLGIFASNRMISKYPRSSGDITAINMAGLIGFSWGISVAFALDTEGSGAFTSSVVGILGGLAVSGLATRNTKYSNLEGGLISIGSIAGGALGIGIANLVDSGETGYFFSTSIGLTVGWISCSKFLSHNSSSLKSLGFGERIRWNINPASIGMVMSSSEKQANLMRQNIRMDLLTINYALQ